MEGLDVESGQGQEIFLLSKRARPSMGLMCPTIQPVSGLLFGGKATGNKIDHVPPSSAESKNEWRYYFTPPIHLYGVDMDFYIFNFTM